MAKRREVLRIIQDEAGIKSAVNWLARMVALGLPGGPVQVSIGRERRNKDQNAKLWPMLNDISKQVVWHGIKLTSAEWKDVITAGLKAQKVVPGIDGGFVVVGMSTSRMTKQLFCDLVEFIYWFGAEQNVVWSEPQKDAKEMWKGEG